MALGLTGCGLVGPCLEPTSCLSIVDPCSTDKPPPDCPTPTGAPTAADELINKVRPSVCLSILPVDERPPPATDCDAAPDHPDCPPVDEVKKKVLEDGVLPDDVEEKVQ